jgi:NADH-quinone oxidoreductase subunit L
LAIVDAIMALIGIVVAWLAWREGPVRPRWEPKFFANVWYWDNFYDAIIGRPGHRLAEEAARVDIEVIDGAVMATAAIVTKRAQALRRMQTGQVRQYALFIAAGLLAILVFLLVKAFHP